MASKTKKGKKDKKQSKPKSTVIVDFRRPRKPGAVLALATNGGDPNKGRMSPQDYMKAFTAYAEGSSPGIVLYQPALAQIAADGSGLVATCGRGKSQPDNWNEGQLGKWSNVTDEDGSVKSGDVINKVRLHHNKDLRKRCVEGGCVTIDGIGPVVLGINAINPQTTGNYAHIIAAAKAACFSDEKQTAKLVGLINDAPCDETLEHGGTITWAAYNAIDWGYLTRSGKRLTHEQISKIADGGNADGVEFEALDEAIVGTPISVSKLVTAVKAAMSKAGTKRDGEDETAWDRFGYESDDEATQAVEQNIATLTRFDPRSMGCFGLRNVQTGIPFFFTFSEDGQTKMVNMVIGCRLPTAYAETQWDANARVKAATPEATEDATPAPAKPKRTRKAKSKVKDTEATDATEADAEAPPVEDTAETETTEEAVTAADVEVEDEVSV